MFLFKDLNNRGSFPSLFVIKEGMIFRRDSVKKLLERKLLARILVQVHKKYEVDSKHNYSLSIVTSV